MKKYTLDQMLQKRDCINIGINCKKCPFWLKENDKKYNTDCKAIIYCIENNIHFMNDPKNIHPSEHYIKFLKNNLNKGN